MKNGVRLINLGLTRGTAETITPEKVWAELHSIALQRMAGLQPTGPVRSGRQPINVRELVRGLE